MAITIALVMSSVTGAAHAALPVERDTRDEGLVLSSALWIGGDVTLETDVPETGLATAAFDDLSLLARWEPTTRLALFGELRVEDVAEWREGDGLSSAGGEVRLERGYLEALVTPTFALRLGRVFTPFGLWNVVRRAPLTWTVEAPAAAEDVFPEHATGLSLLHRSTWRGWTIDATTYGPVQDEPAIQHSDEKGWLAGARLAVARSIGSAFAGMGLNAAGFRTHDDPDWTTATGLDLELAAAGHQLASELTFRIPASGGRAEFGAYVQDVLPLRPLASEIYGVLRFEAFQPAHGGTAIGLLGGLFWRPLPRLVLRADYLFSTRALERLDPGFRGSISILL